MIHDRERRPDGTLEDARDDDALVDAFAARVAAGGDPVQSYLDLVAPAADRVARAPIAPGRRSLSEQIETDGGAAAGVIARASDGGTVGTSAARAIAAARTGGRRLDDELRRLLATALGYDLDTVRVHTGPAADAAAREVGARAFALGADLFFRDGTYDPGSAAGVRLIAHEVAHVAQAGRGELSAGPGLAISEPGDTFERAADQFADDIAGRAGDAHAPAPLASAPAIGAAGPGLRRDPDPAAAPAISEDDKKKLLELNGLPMPQLLTGVEGLPDDKRALYAAHLDEVAGIDPKRMKLAFRAVTAKQAGTTARDFAFTDADMYAMCRSLGFRDQREALFRYVEPGFKPPAKKEPGTVIAFKDGREGVIHRGYIKRQRGKNQLPWMCNNPGAVGNGPSFKSPNTYGGKTLGPAAINVYPSEEDGMKGLTAWITFQGEVNDMTFGGFFHAHAPADDGKPGNKGNDPEAYFQRVAAQMGLDPKTARGTKIKTMDARKIADGIAAVGEGYRLGGDVLIQEDDTELDRETWFALMYWETRG